MPLTPGPRHARPLVAATGSPAPQAPATATPKPAEGDTTVAERQQQRSEPPRLYQVLMLNDDFTPMEFVVLVLQEYFRHDLDTATLIMLKIHHEGRGVCGVYSKDIAATKVELVTAAAKSAGHPLQCVMEPA